MTSTTTSAAEWAEIVTRHAQDWRASGVTRVVANGCEVELGPEPLPAPKPGEIETPNIPNAIDDPETFGGSLPERPRR